MRLFYDNETLAERYEVTTCAGRVYVLATSYDDALVACYGDYGDEALPASEMTLQSLLAEFPDIVERVA